MLKAEDQLSEEHCRAWQTGEISSLDEAFRHPRRIRRLLQSAASFARGLNLVSEPVTYFGVDGLAGQPLAASTDPLLNELLSCRYSPPDSDQGDLFMDGGRTARINALMDAIVMRDPGRARRELSRISDRAPDYKYLTHAEKLISALETPPPDSLASGLERLERMQRHWQPAACEFLGESRGGKALAQLWLDVAHALEGAAFDAGKPDRHCSYAFEKAGAWKLLNRSVLAESAFRKQPVLLARLAGAESRVGNRTQALKHWFAMCLLAPAEFAGLVESSHFEDPTVARAWQQAIAEGDVHEELSAEWFPAWMLIHERGLASAFPDMDGESGPERAFNLVRALRLMQRGTPGTPGTADPESVSIRGELKQLRPGLLRSYLARRDRER